MQFANVVQLNASRDAVWAFLQDPQTIEQCIPGMEQVVVSEGGRVVAGIARLSMGASSLRLPARLEWVERRPPQSGALRAVTRVSGFEIEGTGTVALAAEADGRTELSWEMLVTVPPPLAHNPMLSNVAHRVASRFINEFFSCVEARFSRFDTPK